MGRTLKRNRKKRTKTLRHNGYEQEGGKGFLANAHRAFKTLFGHERGDSQRKRLAARHAEIEKLESHVKDRSSLSGIITEYSVLERDVNKFSTMSKQLETLRERNQAGLAKLAEERATRHEALEPAAARDAAAAEQAAAQAAAADSAAAEAGKAAAATPAARTGSRAPGGGADPGTAPP